MSGKVMKRLRRMALRETGGHEGIVRSRETGETRRLSFRGRLRQYKEAYARLHGRGDKVPAAGDRE